MSGAATKSEMVTRHCIHKYCCIKCSHCFIVKCISKKPLLLSIINDWFASFINNLFLNMCLSDILVCSFIWMLFVFYIQKLFYNGCDYFEQFFDLLDASSHSYLFYFSNFLLSFLVVGYWFVFNGNGQSHLIIFSAVISIQFRISPHRRNVILGIENRVKKDCFRNAPWSIICKLHAVCEQSWVQNWKIY